MNDPLVQNIFGKDPSFRTISLNAGYIGKRLLVRLTTFNYIESSVIFKSPRDSSQITHLAKQVVPGETDLLVSAYRQATEEAHSYLLIDLQQGTPDIYRFRSNVVPEKAYVYVSPKIDGVELFKEANGEISR